MNPQLILAMILSFLSFAGGYKLSNYQNQEKENERLSAHLAAVQSSAATAIRRQDNVIAAQNAAVARQVVLARDIAGARDAIVSLHAAADQALRDASTSLDSCNNHATKLNLVFMECSRVYEKVARDADGWQNDATTLKDAFPKE